MEKQATFLFFLLLFCLTTISSGISDDVKKIETHQHGKVKLLVFGDSYVDTGNMNKNIGPWQKPYGITFPGKPSGRFSDGLVLTDYIASFLGIRSPVPYQWRNTAKWKIQSGMNFAYGGSGVFNTWVYQNLNFQINLFKQLVDQKVYTKSDLRSHSIALVCPAGNDYTFYLVAKNGTLKNIGGLTRRIIERVVKNLQHIHDLGVGKVVVMTMEPAGCLPHSIETTTSPNSYEKCNEIFNSLATFHNMLLQQAVRKLNQKMQKKKSVFVVLDIYKAFMSAMRQHEQNTGNLEYKNPLKPCYRMVISENSTRYEVCEHPELSFFWDSAHPSQNGWHSIYLALKSSLHKLFLN